MSHVTVKFFPSLSELYPRDFQYLLHSLYCPSSFGICQRSGACHLGNEYWGILAGEAKLMIFSRSLWIGISVAEAI